ncbi:MAG TPA: hypothetical protein VG267_20375 [Terracidiphilus sp.]|jgi:hypothetical protein|nr:hypothetical protein [Terracidiphilus sp.]
MAKRVALDGKATGTLTEVRILDAPRDFPDGDYVLHLEPIMFSVRRRGGEWLLGNELLTEHKISQPPMASAS